MDRHLRNIGVIGLSLALLLGTATIAVAAPANDSPETAQAISSLPFSTTASNTTATTGTNEPNHCSLGGAIWYSFTPSQNLRVEASTAGSNFDTVISIYKGSPSALEFITCSDDYSGSSSLVRWDAVSATTYYIAAGGFSKSAGDLRLSVKSIPTDLDMTLTFDPVEWVNAASGSPVILGTLDCSVPADNVPVSIYVEQGRSDAYGNASVDCDGPTRFITTFSSYGEFSGGLAAVTGSATFGGDTAEATDSPMLVACTRFGTLQADSMNGSGRKDKLCGLDGNDTISGGAGDDTLRGGEGHDTLRGGDGNDLIFGGFGNDRLYGQAGNDTLRGNEKNDFLDGGPGSDVCNGDQGFNRKTSC